MGWWRADENGFSLYLEETGMIWGDGPADIMSIALLEIRKDFREEWGRNPTEAELIGGLRFALGGIESEEENVNA